MINDLDKHVEGSKVTLFADDTRVSNEISKESDIEDLQANLENIYEWQRTKIT